MNETKLTAPQMTVLEALRNGATIERRSRPTTVAGKPCTMDLGRFLISKNAAPVRLHNNVDITPALIIWSDEMKATDSKWHVWGTISTVKYSDQEGHRVRGPYINSLPNLIKMGRDSKKCDHADWFVLSLTFPNGMKAQLRNGSGHA